MKIAPCPFCGKIPQVEGKILRHINRRCIAGNMEVHFQSEADAIASWNEQYIRSRLEALAGKLEQQGLQAAIGSEKLAVNGAYMLISQKLRAILEGK